MYPNKISISNGEGQVSITAISRAFEVGQVAEDFDLSKYTSVEHDSDKNFLVIPLTAGTIKVHLCGAPSILLVRWKCLLILVLLCLILLIRCLLLALLHNSI